MITHIAAALGPDQLQRCARCGVVLKDFRDAAPHTPSQGPRNVGVIYPEGAIVEVGPSWFAMRVSPLVDVDTLCPSVFATVDALARFAHAEAERLHAELYPTGCPEGCTACERRIVGPAVEAER